MGSMPSQRFAEFRDNLPIRCQCNGIFVAMDIDEEKYQKRILYICSKCGHAICIGDFTQSSDSPPKHLEPVV